ncbi:MAG: DUF1549 domain-containing protein [Planctomycetaceae bacterium]|nr:DUF1549 domain-containing protein [Planctomycetaceae bacterium]
MLGSRICLLTAAHVLAATACFGFFSIPSSVAQTPADAIPVIPSFEHDVMAVLSRSGCNMGTCHGNANGKGSLKLSLRGQDPAADFETLTRQLAGRRISPLDPESSLLLRKPLMLIPHEGGRRFQAEDHEFQILRNWIAAGQPSDPAGHRKLIRLQAIPEQATIVAPKSQVRIQLTAHFSDGSSQDVTNIAVLTSSNIAMDVHPDGTVSSAAPGLTTVSARYLHLQIPVRLEFVAENPDFQFTAPGAANVIDELVFAQLKRLRMNPSAVCDDSTFVRRVWLDTTGLIPPAAEARRFVASTDPDKRSALIDRLLASDEFTDLQTMRWADLLRAEEKTLDATGLKVYHDWIHASMASDMPLNEFVAKLTGAEGSTYKVPETNFYRALRKPDERAEAAAQVFLGIRLQCAKCHNHPFDHWTQDDYYNWTNYFARIDYEIIENKRRDSNDKHEFVGEQIVRQKDEGDVTNVRTGHPASLGFLGDEHTTTDTANINRLAQLSAWFRSDSNRRFAMTQANRIWFQLMGRGIVDPIDDFRATNPAVNPELLNALTDIFINEGFQTRPLMRLILNSHTYQLSSVTNATNAGDVECFSHVTPLRLTAEQTLDAVSRVLETTASFGGHPEGTRAVQLIGVRNGEFRYAKPESGDRFLRLFGRPNRLQSCECERTNETTLAQTFEMISGEVMTELIARHGNRIDRAVSSDQSTDEFLTDLYWAAFSRAPGESEQKQMTEYVNRAEDRRAALQDVVWAVMNSNEFLVRR